MIAGAALGISAIVTRGKKNGRDMSGEFMNWDEKHYGVWKPNETAHEENKRLGKEEYPAGIYKTSIKIVAICAATTGVIVWCVTQKITGRMVTSDEYTLVQGAIAAAAGVSFILCGIERKGPDKYEYKNDLQAEFTNKKQKFL
jgi:hypothetical protein